MTGTHDSLFSYNVSRTYPYRWFTWVVFIGGVIATVIFSLINFVAAGFEIVQVYTSNVTLIETPENLAWYQRRPWSLASKIVPNCTAQLISTGSTLFTSYSAFPYTVDLIISDLNDTDPTILGPQAYKNTPIGDCTRISIQAGMDAGDLNAAPGWDIQIKFICTVHFAERDASVQFSSEFASSTLGFGNLVGTAQTNSLGVFNLPADSSNDSSLLWANLLIGFDTSAWDVFLTRNETSFFVSHMDLSWRIASDGSEDEVYPGFQFYFVNQSSVNMLLAEYEYVSEVDGKPGAVGLRRPLVWQWSNASLDNGIPVFIENNNGTHPNISIASGWYAQLAALTDGIGKLIYWTLLTDLGQSATNMLADPSGLMEYSLANARYLCSQNLSDPWNVDDFVFSCNSSAAPHQNVSSFYAASGLGVPNVQPAVFAQEYSCQVPKLKPAGSLVISIIVADLVFLQALWTILNWLTTLVLTRRDKRAKYCAGCEEALTELRRLRDDIETDDNQTTHNQVLPKTAAVDSALKDDVSSALMESVDVDNQHLSRDEETAAAQETLLRPASSAIDR